MHKLSDTHVYISAMGSKGDIHPLVGIAIEMRERGAKSITFLVNDVFRGLLAKHGFGHISTGTEENQIEFTNDERVWDPECDTAEIGWVRTIRPAIETSYRVIEDAHRSGENVLVVGIQSMMNGALMAAEVHDLPSVHITLAPWQVAAQSMQAPAAPLKWTLLNIYTKNMRKRIIEKTKSEYMERMRQKDHFWQLNGMRRYRKLKPIHDYSADVVFTDKSLQICLFPGWFGQPVSDWPENINLTGFPLFDDIRHDARKDVREFIDKRGKPIIFTFGTGVFNAVELFEVGLEACEKIGRPGLFVGGEIDEDFIDSDNHLHVGYVDFESVFPECLAVVHHGGIGTMAQAIRAGIPQLIRPQAFDQYDNADKVLNLALGLHILGKNFNARKVAGSLDVLINSQHVKDRAAYYSSLIKRSSPIDDVCDLIESSLASTRHGRYFHPFKRAVAESRATLAKAKVPDIPLIKRKTGLFRKKPRLNGNAEALSMLCRYYQPESFRQLELDHCKNNLTLADMIEACKKISIDVRALSCQAQYLVDIKLPCLVQWQLNRFVVLVALSDSEIVIRDPIHDRQEYTLHEFVWNYSGIVLEVAA